MRYEPSNPTWQQFRRLLLGTVVEGLVEVGLPVDLPSVVIVFDRESDFRVPRLDNFMRFKGELRAELTGKTPSRSIEKLESFLEPRWQELLEAMSVIPIGDRLTATRDRITATIETGGQLTIAFDLEAD